MFKQYGFVDRGGEYVVYTEVYTATWPDLCFDAGSLYVEVCEDPGVCFFLVHHKTKTYDEAPKFKTLEAAVAVALVMGVPE